MWSSVLRRAIWSVWVPIPDKRKVIVMLTDAGHRLIDSTTDNAMRITEMTYGQLNPAERVALIYLLKKMLDDTSQP